VEVPALLAVGRVARAHGLRGRILLQPYNDDSEGLERASALWLRPKGSSSDPKRFAVDHAERVNLGYLVTLQGIADRNAAEALQGSEALVDRAELPDLESDEMYAADLVGMSVADERGQERGTVTDIEAAGPNDLLHVKTAERTVLVPVGLIRSIDRDGRRLTIEAPEGLFEVS
jgi:16S rRNA processing protein RimM